MRSIDDHRYVETIARLRAARERRGLTQPAIVGLIRLAVKIGESKDYQDYGHISGKHVELKLLYLDHRRTD